MKKVNLSWAGAVLVFALLLWCTAATPGTIAAPSTYTCAVYSTALSLLPPVVAIVLALNTKEVYTSLLRRHLQTLRIHFEGEPLEGIQIMGILETRNLDFENVVLLSMNDDNFPGNHMAQASFVPYNLRAAYGLPTPEHHEGDIAYYFYRLVQRARRVWMLYCSHADDK